jgi:Flp pilus assembly protein TadD
MVDPHNNELREITQSAKTELAMVSLMVGGARPKNVIETMLMSGSEGSQRLSTIHHNRGVDRAKRGDFKGAIQELEEALELEPTSDETKQVLAEVIAAQASFLCNKGAFEEALTQIERGLGFAPDNQTLMQSRKIICARRLNQRLASGDASSEEFLEVLRHLLGDK